MDGEAIFGCIIMTFCSFGCGLAFFLVGEWARKSEKPMHFYSGSTVDPRTITDIKAYNAENARMWKLYAVPYMLCGLFAIAGLFYSLFSYIAIGLLVFSGTFGIGWLVSRYHKIEKTYKTVDT